MYTCIIVCIIYATNDGVLTQKSMYSMNRAWLTKVVFPLNSVYSMKEHTESLI